VRLTDKGREATKGNEKFIPAYTKEMLKVMGITSQSAQVELKWRIMPTAVGEAFDYNSQTYRNLPSKLRELLKNHREHYSGRR
jgi:hypothetical protein